MTAKGVLVRSKGATIWSSKRVTFSRKVSSRVVWVSWKKILYIYTFSRNQITIDHTGESRKHRAAENEEKNLIHAKSGCSSPKTVLSNLELLQSWSGPNVTGASPKWRSENTVSLNVPSCLNNTRGLAVYGSRTDCDWPRKYKKSQSQWISEHETLTRGWYSPNTESREQEKRESHRNHRGGASRWEQSWSSQTIVLGPKFVGEIYFWW